MPYTVVKNYLPLSFYNNIIMTHFFSQVNKTRIERNVSARLKFKDKDRKVASEM